MVSTEDFHGLEEEKFYYSRATAKEGQYPFRNNDKVTHFSVFIDFLKKDIPKRMKWGKVSQGD